VFRKKSIRTVPYIFVRIADLKVVVSFVTIASTLENQFGIVWPGEWRGLQWVAESEREECVVTRELRCAVECFSVVWLILFVYIAASFARALEAMAVFSLDIGVILGGFCIFEVSFYNRLLSSTLLLLITLVAIIMGPRVMASKQPSVQNRRTKRGLFIAIYLLLFLYPVLSVTIVEAFACHEVEGTHYLQADYNVRCDSQEWKAMAAYAAVWIAAYVVGFPLFVLYKLWSYHAHPTATRHQSTRYELLDLRFLLHDYKSIAPALLWEGECVGGELGVGEE
jgi:nitrate reductase NapE component